jgi:hypothetical protein
MQKGNKYLFCSVLVGHYSTLVSLYFIRFYAHHFVKRNNHMAHTQQNGKSLHDDSPVDGVAKHTRSQVERRGEQIETIKQNMHRLEPFRPNTNNVSLKDGFIGFGWALVFVLVCFFTIYKFQFMVEAWIQDEPYLMFPGQDPALQQPSASHPLFLILHTLGSLLLLVVSIPYAADWLVLLDDQSKANMDLLQSGLHWLFVVGVCSHILNLGSRPWQVALFINANTLVVMALARAGNPITYPRIYLAALLSALLAELFVRLSS